MEELSHASSTIAKSKFRTLSLRAAQLDWRMDRAESLTLSAILSVWQV